MAAKDIGELLDRFIGYANSEENKNRKKFWLGEEPDNYFPIERWRGRPARKNNTACTMAMDISGYSPLLGIDCAKFYSDPETNLREQLRYGIWEYENIPCGRYFEKSVFCSIGSVFEAALFGAKIHFLPDQAPWYDEKDPLIKEKGDLLKIKPFSFDTSGLVPTVKQMYEHHVKETEGYDITPVFPIPIRSPFSIAIMLRGFENLLVDILDDPDFFEDMMEFITDYLKEYSKARASYLGEKMPKGFLFNDEISTPMLSPGMYEEYIYPYEEKLSEFWGGIRYWHSCGKSEAFYESVSKLPGLQLMHIGPWSDVEKAAKVFGDKDISIEICRNSNRDLFEKSKEQMINDLQEIKNACEGKVKYQIRMDGIAVFNSLEFTMKKIQEWKDAVETVFPDVD